MGLDMFIKKGQRSEVAPSFQTTTEVAYWRKFNALHQWFVDNVQSRVDDCQYYIVTQEKLEQILNLLKSLTPENCDELLPTQSGFFFGGTEYDEYYWEDVSFSIETIQKLISETDFESEYLYYHSSW